MEMTIAMLISAIVIGITYSAYQIISKSYFNFNNKNSDLEIVIRVDELLRKDFIKADDITFSNKTLTFKDSSQLIKYQFEPDYIIRYSAITDTFKMKTSNMFPLFETKPVLSPDDDQEKHQSLDEFYFTTLLTKDSVAYHYHKHYSAVQLIKLTANAGN